MKKILAIILALALITLFPGCNSGIQTNCEHSWEQAENLNEYTAVDKCSKCGVTRMYTDPDAITHSGTEAGFKMLRYNWDGWGISQKEIKTCDLAYAVIDSLSGLHETGETVPKISNDTLDESSGELPVTRGTVWIDCGSVGMFRLNREMTEICKVEAPFGEGKILEMTDTLRELLEQAWFYYPYDCWYGKYENGSLTLEQFFKADSAVDSVVIDSIHIENTYEPHNKIVLSIRSSESKIIGVSLRCQQSGDNLAAGDFKDIVLTEGKETKAELTFGGFKDVTYYVTIFIDNTRISLTVKP
ncbi:MAG: hypothetical protein ACI3XI_08985 [Eubacteriales bacterium]